jgi:hypothetical protein
MVSIGNYWSTCSKWSGEGEVFCWLVQNSDIVGVTQRHLALEFEFAPSTISRWASGAAVPHKRVQGLIVSWLGKKAKQVEQAQQRAEPIRAYG